MRAEQPPRAAVVVLVRDDVEARALAQLLDSLVRAGAAPRPVIHVPSIRGVDHLMSSGSVDASVPAAARRVYLLCHEQQLPPALARAPGEVLVAAGEDEASMYPAPVVVHAGVDDAALALAEAVVRRLDARAGDAVDRDDLLFEPGAADMIARVRRHRSSMTVAERPPPEPPAPHRRPVLPALFDVAGGRPGDDSVPPSTGDPLSLLAADSSRLHTIGHATSTRTVARPRGTVVRGVPPPRRRRTAPSADDELASLLLARSPTLVAVGSRKGGVGKTSHAAGIAISAGEVLDGVGHTAAIVDANIANPDAWGQLVLPGDAATVRDVVAALARGQVPPRPVHSTTPALACFPEGRHGSEYTRTDIRRFAAHLRARYALVVVDLSNRLPDPLSGPEATVAAYWLEEADALVLPTAMSRQDFDGVLDYLDVRGLPPTVVPCIVSSRRRNRRHPVTRQYMDLIAARVDSVIEVPDEADSIRLAGMDGVPVQEVSPVMGRAYREMTGVIARLPRRVRA